MKTDAVALFALDRDDDLGDRMAARLGLTLAGLERRDFEDGEHKIRPTESVRGRDCFVLAGLHGNGRQSVNDKLCRLAFCVGTLKDAGAGRVTVVAPYLCYSRKDRRTKPRDPVTTRYLAQVLEAVGIDLMVTLDVHNLAAFQNAFRRPTEHLEARPLFVRHFASLIGEAVPVVLSPDIGGMKRAERFREGLARAIGREPGVGFMEKQRSGGEVSSAGLVAAVRGRVVVIVDDLISSGTTLRMAAEGCREQGAVAVYAAATHGVFAAEASKVLADPVFDGIVVTDSIPPFRLDPGLLGNGGKVTVLDTAPLLAEAVRRLHEGGSIVELVEEG